MNVMRNVANTLLGYSSVKDAPKVETMSAVDVVTLEAKTRKKYNDLIIAHADKLKFVPLNHIVYYLESSDKNRFEDFCGYSLKDFEANKSSFDYTLEKVYDPVEIDKEYKTNYSENLLFEYLEQCFINIKKLYASKK